MGDGKLQNPRLWLVQKPILMIRVLKGTSGDNPMIAGKYRVKNLQRIMENIEAWSTKPNEDYKQS